MYLKVPKTIFTSLANGKIHCKWLLTTNYTVNTHEQSYNVILVHVPSFIMNTARIINELFLNYK